MLFTLSFFFIENKVGVFARLKFGWYNVSKAENHFFQLCFVTI